MLNILLLLLNYLPFLFVILFLYIVVTFLFRKRNRSNTTLSILCKNYYNKQSRPSYLQILFVFCLTVMIASAYSRLGIDVYHQGFLFHTTVKITEGKMLFKDIYYHYGALTALLQALAVWLFGKSLIVIQLQTALFYGFTSIFLWLIWSRFMPPVLATISSIICICLAPYYTWKFLPWSSVHSLFFMALSLYLFIIFLEKNYLIYLYFTGVAVSLTFWCKQSVGFLLFFAILTIIIFIHIIEKTDINKTMKNIWLFFGGNLSVSIVFYSWLLLNGAVVDWWIQVFWGQFDWAFCNSNIDRTFSLLETLLKLKQSLLPNNVWAIFPLVTILMFLCVLTDIDINKKIKTDSAVLLSLVFVSLASWHQYFPVPCPRHLYWAATPMIGIFIYYLWWTWKSTIALFKARKIILPMGLLLLAFLSSAFIGMQVSYNIKSGINKIDSYRVKVTTPEVLSGMMVTDETQAQSLREIDRAIKDYIKNHPDTTFISLSNTNVLFLTFIENNENFSKLPIPSFNSKFFSKIYNYNEKLVKFIKKKKPLIFTDVPWLFYDYYELSHVLTKPTSRYDTGSWYLYAPVEPSKNNAQLS